MARPDSKDAPTKFLFNLPKILMKVINEDTTIFLRSISVDVNFIGERAVMWQ